MKSLNLNIDNQTLVDECRSGDRDAMSILYTSFAPRMLHVINRYVNDRDCAQDILHDGFIAAFTRIETLRDPGHIEFWLATIMKNLSLKYLQAQTVTSILEEIPEIVEEPEIDDIIDFDTLETLIRKLPEGYQKVFRLAVLEGKTHKEISEILGIAPNSSSSQLFHAKIRMRELIKDYRLRAGLISLLLIILSTGLLLLTLRPDLPHSKDSLSANAIPDMQDPASVSHQEPAVNNMPEESSATTAPSRSIPARRIYAHSVNPHTEEEGNATDGSQKEVESVIPIVSDTIENKTTPEKQERLPLHNPEDDYGYADDIAFADIHRKASASKGWAAGISVDQGLRSFNGFGFHDYESSSSTNVKPPVNDQNPPTPPDEETGNDPAPTRGNDNDLPSDFGSMSRRHYMPISFELNIEKRLNSWSGLESGISYAYLHSDYEGNRTASTCHWHYLQVPVKLNVYAYQSDRLSIYGSAEARLSIPVYSFASIRYREQHKSVKESLSCRPVWSAGAGIGISWNLTKHLNLFVEPTLQYHFPTEYTVPNIWTDDEPWSISIPIGFRFKW